jgi:hypothetical protein
VWNSCNVVLSKDTATWRELLELVQYPNAEDKPGRKHAVSLNVWSISIDGHKPQNISTSSATSLIVRCSFYPTA